MPRPREWATIHIIEGKLSGLAINLYISIVDNPRPLLLALLVWQVVEDITEEKDVDLILDIHKEPQFTSVPQPMTTGKVNVDELCNQYKWRFCVNIGGQEAEKNKLFYTCEVRAHFRVGLSVGGNGTE